mgnify:FL=1
MSIDFYNNNAETFFDSTKAIDMSVLYDEFLPHLKANANILDAGCGSARDSLYFKKQGFNVTAFDASASLVKLAEKLLNQKVELATFESFANEQKFDGIWACASLLHVPKQELNSILNKLSGLLNVGGIFYCSFKYGDKMVERGGRTFTNLNESLLREKIENTALRITKTWVTADQRPDRADEKWLNAILIKHA